MILNWNCHFDGRPAAGVNGGGTIAAKHYLQVTDQHFDRAIAGHGSDEGKAAQNTAQQAHAGARKASHEQSPKMKNPAICGALHEVASGCDDPNKLLIPPRGVEPLFAD